jgi:hypothetical protein
MVSRAAASCLQSRYQALGFGADAGLFFRRVRELLFGRSPLGRDCASRCGEKLGSRIKL